MKNVAQWCNDNNMAINTKKCYVHA